MKNEAERNELLADVLTGETSLRATTLELGLAEMQRLRKHRRAARVAVFVWAPLLLLAAALFFREFPKSANPPPSALVNAEALIPGTSIEVLSDEQLLALFKGRPVALVGPAGHQRLLLLDEAAN